MVIRTALRRLWTAPVFSLTVIALVAFTVGISILVAAVASEMVFVPSTTTDRDRLIKVYTSYDAEPVTASGRYGPTSLLDYRDLELAIGGRAMLAGYVTAQLPVRVDGNAAPVTMQFITPSYFEVAGVRPFLGTVGGGAVDGVVISHRFWNDRLGGADDVLGTSVLVNDVPFVVQAVLPPRHLGTEYARAADLWLPLAAFTTVQPGADNPVTYRDERRIAVLGRLGPGVTLADCAPALRALGDELQRLFPETNSRRSFHAVPFPHLLGPAERAIFGIDGLLRRGIAMLAAILLLAYANIGNLFAVRGLLARREVAIRKALGGSDTRLVMESLMPLVVLVVPGALLGLVAAQATFTQWLSEGPGFARAEGLVSPWTVMALVVGGIVAMVVLGSIPAFWTQRQDPASALSGAEYDLPRPHARVMWGLVAVQVAIACAAGGIVYGGIERVRALERVEPGFDRDRLVDARVALRVGGRMGADVYAEEQRFLARVRALPGVEAVATAEVGLLRDLPLRQSIGVVGREFVGSTVPSALFDVVSAEYFEVLGIPVLAGGFTPAAFEGTFTEVMVNRAFADTYLRAGRELEETVLLRERYPIRVVGVVGNAALDALREHVEPRMYLPARRQGARGQFYLLVRTTGPADPLADAIARHVSGDRMVERAGTFRSLAARRDGIIDPVRAIVRTLAIVVIAIVGLVSIGAYGILAVSLISTRRATAIRLALGGTPGRIAIRSLRPAMLAVGLGAAAALALGALAGSTVAFRELSVTGVALALPTIVLALGLAVAPLVRRVLRYSPAEIMRL